MMKPLCSHLLGADCISRFCRYFLLYSFQVFCYSVPLLTNHLLRVCNFTLRRFRVFLLHCCPILGRFKIVMFHFLPLFLLLCFFCVQRYCKYLYLPNILPKNVGFLTYFNK